MDESSNDSSGNNLNKEGFGVADTEKATLLLTH